MHQYSGGYAPQCGFFQCNMCSSMLQLMNTHPVLLRVINTYCGMSRLIQQMLRDVKVNNHVLHDVVSNKKML